MSSIEVIETKLDILIADFQRFKSILAGIAIAVVLPMTAYLYAKVEQNSIGVAIHKESLAYKAIKEEKDKDKE